MDGPCRCRDDLPGRTTADDLRHALAKALEEIDGYRAMLDLPSMECRRTFDESELAAGAALGLVTEFRDGLLKCWPDS